MQQPFLILLLHFISASDCRSKCLRFLLFKVLEVSLIIDYLKYYRLFFWGGFKINFSGMFLRDQIFHVVLEQFISEVVRK